MASAQKAQKVRLAVAGAGLIGRAHIERIVASSSCELAAIVEPMPSNAAWAAQFGAPCFNALRELLDSRCCDGIVLATPNALHVEQALECIAAGVPILLEKPISDNLGDAQRLCQVVDETKAVVLIGHHRAHSPIMARAKQAIDEGLIGKVVAVMGSAVFYKPDDYFDAAPWRREKGGGPILINMIHEVHSLRMLCGEIASVQAFASNATRQHEVEDTVAINLCFASGALGSFMLSDTAASARSWEQTSQENKSYPCYDDEDCYVIAGTFGSLSVPTMRLKTFAKTEDRSWWKPFERASVAVERADPLVNQIEHFVRVVRREESPIVSARDGLNNLRITHAITAATKSGQAVSTLN